LREEAEENEKMKERYTVEVVRIEENEKFKGCEFETGSMCFGIKSLDYDPNTLVYFINLFDHSVVKHARTTSCKHCI